MLPEEEEGEIDKVPLSLFPFPPILRVTTSTGFVATTFSIFFSSTFLLPEEFSGGEEVEVVEEGRGVISDFLKGIITTRFPVEVKIKGWEGVGLEGERNLGGEVLEVLRVIPPRTGEEESNGGEAF